MRGGHADSFTVPTDFSKASIKVKWVVDDTNKFILKQAQDAPVVADNTHNNNFRDWVNVYHYQKRPTSATAHLPGFATTSVFTQFADGVLTPDPTKAGAGSKSPSAILSGDLHDLTLTLGGIFGVLGQYDAAHLSADYQHNFLDKGIKIQYSVAARPGTSFGSTDWVDGWPKNLTTINGATRELWIRIAPIDENAGFSFSII